MTKFSSAKSEMWEDFRCYRIKKLPSNFFEKLPLIHESGISFAYLAYLSGKEPFNQTDWIKGKLNFFHISELTDIPREHLEKNFYILSRLKVVDRDSLIKGYDFLITEESFLLKESRGSIVSYKVFSRVMFDDYLKSFNYKVKAYQIGKSCFYRDGRFCIEFEDDSVISLFKRSTIIIFAGSLFILIMICYVLYTKIRQQKIEEERKKHALSVLTHELRTPIANLLLQIESINQHSDELSEHLLEDFLKIEGEIYRLKRLTEKSTSYLNSLAGKDLIAFDKKVIPSVNDIHERLLENYTMRGVTLELLKKDTPFHLDIYWWHMCVKNLVENALNHGRAPIIIQLFHQDNELTLKVLDQGEPVFEKLSDYINKKNKVTRSEGLGIGLSLVFKIMKEMKGELLYTSKPKAFILKIKDER
jgi:anti-sigma regulatory factor (Ser/Thr protein kinase)